MPTTPEAAKEAPPMTVDEIKTAYRAAVADRDAKLATKDEIEKAYGTACAELDASERAAADLLAKLQAAIVSGSL